MPHIKFTCPYRTSDGKTHQQGETVYVSSKDAAGILADGRGHKVTPTPAEVVELATGKKPKAKPAPAAKAEPAEPKQPRRPAPAPAPAETKKPEDG